MRDLVTNDCTGMRQKRPQDIFLELCDEIQIGPRLVAVLYRRHPEDQIVDIFKVTCALALVGETQDHGGDLEVSNSHELACATHHLCQIIAPDFFLVRALLSQIGTSTIEREAFRSSFRLIYSLT